MAKSYLDITFRITPMASGLEWAATAAKIIKAMDKARAALLLEVRDAERVT